MQQLFSQTPRRFSDCYSHHRGQITVVAQVQRKLRYQVFPSAHGPIMKNAIRANFLWALLGSGLVCPAIVQGEQPLFRFERMLSDIESGAPRPVITAISALPPSELLSTSGDDHITRVWDMQTGRLVHRLKGHLDWVRCSAFAPNGETLATCGDDGRIILWDTATWTEQKILFDHERPLYSLAFAPDGQTLAAVGFQEYVLLFDIPSFRLRNRLAAPCDDNRVAMFSSDGVYLAVAGRSGTIRIYHMGQPGDVRDFKAHRQRVRALAFMTDRPWLVSGSEDRSLIVWNVLTGAKEFSLATGTQKIHTLICLAPPYVATGGSDNTIRIWDLVQQQEIERLPGHTGTVSSMIASNQTLFSAGFDTTIRQWTVASAK